MNTVFCRHCRSASLGPIVTGLCAPIFLATVFATPCMAQTAGHWSYKVGENLIAPQVSSGDLSGPGPTGVKIDVGHAYAPIVSGTYMLTDNVATELVIGLPYRHDITGKGVIDGAGKIASVQQLPPTLFVQYRFQQADATWRPYLGLGLTYAYFRDARPTSTLNAILGPTTMEVDGRFGLTPQIGAIYRINDRWFIDTSVTKTYLSTRATLTSGCIVRTLASRLDPIAVSVSLGYQF